MLSAAMLAAAGPDVLYFGPPKRLRCDRNEAYLPTQATPTETPTRLPSSNAHTSGPTYHQGPSCEGPEDANPIGSGRSCPGGCRQAWTRSAAAGSSATYSRTAAYMLWATSLS